ncbi:branched-chain amino acid aminotransferase [Natronospora cellulosivora (SeqCode)]
MKIRIEESKNKKAKVDENNLGFGSIFTDHMFIMDYEEGKGWFDPRIVPYGPFEVSPSMSVFHYGQAVFEGLKAYRTPEGKIFLFRPMENMKRLNISNNRMCIPEIDTEFCLEAIKKLVKLEQDWVPSVEGTSLYIRPFIISTGTTLKLKPSSSYRFMVILSPVGAYYPQGINPVDIYVETEYVRAVPGGTGFAKTSGNYAGSMIAQAEAAEKGFVQVLWLDGIERKYVEEVGSMNVFFKIDGEIITPSLQGSVLPGITRDSAIDLIKSWNIPLSEQKISIEEVYQAHSEGRLEESFGTGTAAVISPVGALNWQGKGISINDGMTGDVAKKLYDSITGIQTGKLEDKFGWTVEV